MTKPLRSLVDVCRHWADASPHRLAYSCLGDGEEVKEQLTFGQLDERARAIAAALQTRTTVGDRVLLLYPTGVEYVAAFMGCLYAGLVAVPSYPIHARERCKGRLESIVRDAAPRVALGTSALRDILSSLSGEEPVWRTVEAVSTNEIDASGALQWREPAIAGDTLAFLQYTSGTTNAPRGVMVSHGNLAHQEALLQRTFRQHAASIIVSWLPLYHDMGLIGSVLQTLYAGAHGVLMSPATFLQRPARWLKAIHRFGATTSGGPNFAYDLCVRRVREEDKASLDLSTWEVAFNGAELVRAETMERFAQAFAPCGFRAGSFRPCYGLAESTLMVTASDGAWVGRPVPTPAPAQGPGRRVVSCGAIDGEQRVLIVDPGTRAPCVAGEVGEVWVSGVSVTRGYWQRERETTEVFRARPAGGPGSGDYLRTGDLGFQWRGQLFLAGRLKELIVVRGRNHFPEDLEATIERSDPAVRAECAIACELERDGEGRLLVVQEIDRGTLGTSPHEVIARIRAALAREHEITPHAVVLVEPRSIPRTPSGKKQRRSCAEEFLQGRLRVVASDVLPDEAQGPGGGIRSGESHWSSPDPPALEAFLADATASVLGVRRDAIPTDVPLIQFGLDSLRAAELEAAIESQLGVSVSAGAILAGASISQLGDAIRAAQATEACPAPVAAEAPAGAGLSEAEKAMWFLHKLAADSGVHTIARSARIHGPVDWDALRSAMHTVVARHEAPRTTFPATDGQPQACVHDWLEPHLEHVDASAWDDGALHRTLEDFAWRPFSLERGPLVRLGLFSRSDVDHVLAFVVHHIVADLWSVCVLLDELGQAYATETSGTPPPPPAPAASYRDYLAARERRLATSDGERMLAYWRSILAGAPQALDVFTDRPRSTSLRFAAGTERIRVDAALTDALRRLAEEQEATLYVVLLAAFQVFLHQSTQGNDLVVGSPFHGRRGRRARSIVGCLTNLLVLRADLSGDPAFTDHLARTRASVVGALDHQEYPFQRLVQTLRPLRHLGRTPLCNVVFVFQSTPQDGAWPLFAVGEPGACLQLGPLQLECLAASREATAFELTVTAAACGDEMSLAWTYRTDLFDRSTVLAMARGFSELLERIVAAPHRRIGEFGLNEDIRAGAETPPPRRGQVAGG